MSFLRKALLVNSTEFVCLCLGIVQASIIARTLGPEGVGQYDLIRSALILTSEIFCLGMPLSFLYHSQRNPQNTKKYLMNTIWSVLFIGTVGGVGLVLLMLVKTHYFGFIPWFALIMVGLYVPIFLGRVIARNVLLIRIEARRLSLMRILPVVAFIGMVLIFYSAGILRVPQALLCFFFATFIAAGIGWIWARNYIDFSTKPSWEIIRPLGFMGIRLSWAGVMTLINTQVNILLIKYLLNNFESVGYFSRSQRIAMLVVTAGQAIWPLLFSRWASLAKQKLVNHVEKSLRFAIAASVIIVAGILVMGKWLILLLYGKEFLPAVVPMKILVFGTALFLLGSVLIQLLNSRGSPEFAAAALGFSAAINAGLCWFLIPVGGIAGAAWASTAGNMILLLLLILMVKKKYGIRVTNCILLNKNDFESIMKSLLKKST